MSDTVLMLTPAGEPNYVRGAVLITADCGHRAWISPTGIKFSVTTTVTTRCQNCVDPADVGEMRTMPGGLEELAAHLGPAEAEAVVAQVQRDPAGAVRRLQADSKAHRRRRR